MSNTKITTPIGTAVWPKLNEPDRRFEPEGVYEVKLRLPEDEAEALISKIMDTYTEDYRQACSLAGKKALKKANFPWGPATEKNMDTEEREEIPGMVDFKFKMKAKVTTRSGKSWEQRPVIYDSKLNPITDSDQHVGGGSKIRVSAEVYTWHAASMGFGVSLRPKAVQVIELKTYEGGGGDHGFEETEGYSAARDAGFSEEDDKDF
jgi:hypothetical protein